VNKAKKRSQDAFAIASQQNPDRIKIRQHRLGAAEGGNRPGKRGRQDDDEDDEEDEDEERDSKKRKGAKKGRFDELDLDAGSDSEGNEWKLGEVDSDDDSDLDSDDAFGESDEERFEGFIFGGSSSKSKSSKSSKRANRDIDLDEDEDEDSGSELSEGDLGEDAIDLATMLDQTAEESEEEKKRSSKDKHRSESSEDEESDAESDDSDDESSMSSMDEDDEADPDKIAALQNMIAGLPQSDQKSHKQRQRSDGASEYSTPSDFGLTSKNKLTLADLGLPTVSDPHMKKSLKMLEADAKGTSKKGGKLEVPLARRQQDRLDRAAAYEKSKETLDRWTDTVKANRRAEHLSFPLIDNDVESAQNNSRLQPATAAKPFNDLEATIQSILEESGLAAANGKDDEDKLREFEELEAKKMSLDEVRARRDQLRQARELMFREEARSKRIKKIKSKSYRKVHRKEREKEERLNKEALAEAGVEPSEDELEAQDRARATERMGAKHRGSKWAKATKATGRAAWDEDARDGVTEMARRDEQLRRRVEGKASRKDEMDDSDVSMSDSYSDDSDADDDARKARQLADMDGFELRDDSAPGARLANMKFMRNADAARKKQNDEAVAQIRRDLDGEASSDEDEDTNDVGRRSFGPASTKEVKKAARDQKVSEFEEPAGSDDEDVQFTLDAPKSTENSAQQAQNKRSNGFAKGVSRSVPEPVTESSHEGGAWSRKPVKSANVEERAKERKKKQGGDIGELDLSQAAVIAAPKITKPKSKPTTLAVESDDDSEDDGSVRLPFAIKDQELIKRAFAGADVVGDFESEKRQAIEDEDEKVVDNTLPGWGSWAGDGVSKKEKAKAKGRFLTKTAGIKASDRKDAKLDRVIINQKTVKKVSSLISAIYERGADEYTEQQISCIYPSAHLRDQTAVRAFSQDASRTRVDHKGNLPRIYEAQDPPQAGYYCSHVEAAVVNSSRSESIM
jgi:U3 small nucleolar RNA-associated protein 14